MRYCELSVSVFWLQGKAMCTYKTIWWIVWKKADSLSCGNSCRCG